MPIGRKACLERLGRLGQLATSQTEQSLNGKDGSKAANANDHYWHNLQASEGTLRLWTLFPLHSLAIIKSGDARMDTMPIDTAHFITLSFYVCLAS